MSPTIHRKYTNIFTLLYKQLKTAETQKVSVLPFAVSRNVMLNLSNLVGLGSGDGGLRSLTIPWPPLSEFSGYDPALSE